MAIPDYQSIMLPLLKLLSNKEEHSLKDCVSEIAKSFKLSEHEKGQLLPSGGQTIIHNRTAWAKTYLAKAGLLTSTRRGFFQISGDGQKVLGEQPAKIDQKFLLRFPSFVEFSSKSGSPEPDPVVVDNPETPEEQIERAHGQLNCALATEILAKVKSCTPSFFERLVVDLLLKMGYGGSRIDAGKALGQSGDEGIDGVISEDKLGLDNLYIQAKRWDNPVGRPEIQKFVGALTGQRSKKGIFITTSTFSKDAHEYVKKIDPKVILIDGSMLASLMIENNVGVSILSTFEVKKMDSDYFIDE